jgi:hypothetical protein
VKKSNGRKHKYNKLSTAKRKTRKQLLPALAAVGGACGLAVAPASALELGDIRIESALGQPLRASIAYALSPNEQIFDYCVFLNPGLTANGMPAINRAGIRITDNAIILTGRTPIREPLLAMQLSVRCPYTARLARDYTLMLDPAPPAEAERVTLSTDGLQITPARTSTITATDIPVARSAAPVARSAPRPQDETPIAASGSYRVQPGDSVSQIAARIENRSIALWPAVDAIFAANPDAFLNNDPNLLKAGSLLVIPDMTGTTAIAAANSGDTVQPTTVVPDAEPAATAAAYTGAAVPDALPESVQATQPVETAEPAVAEVIAETAPIPEPAVTPQTYRTAPELRPGDVVIGTDNPFVVPIGADDAVIDIPDTAIEAPQVSQPVPVVRSGETGDTGISGSWSWLLWLGGAGLAIILGLFMFGRQLRDRFGSVAIGAPAMPSRRRDDAPAPRPAISNIDFNFDASTLTNVKVPLDADLGAGTGLDDSAEMDVAQDFGFSASDTELDLEITEHAAKQDELPATDIIPPTERQFDDSTVLHEEILPSDDDDDVEDYDVSVVLDATKHAVDNTSTTRDLQAVLVDTDVVDADDTSEYSMSKETDYHILEQDYEEELTATQALNKEIEEAARALAEQMDVTEASADSDTREMPAAQDPEITAELTANLEAPGDAENEDFDDGSIPDLMVDMPISDNDATLDVESVVVEEEKKEAS